MKHRRIVLLSALLATFVGSGAGATEKAPTTRTTGFTELSTAYVALAIQGDLRPAEALFEHSVGGGAAGWTLRSQFAERFLAPLPAASERTAPAERPARVAEAWRTYWRRTLMRETDEATARSELAESLRALSTTVDDTATPEDLTAAALDAAGLNYSIAPPPPWPDLFAWKRQRLERYRVELSDTTIPVEVVFMNDFVVQGWKDHASLGLASTTGWVEDGRLYCVAWAYDTASENFTVSYLKHETRHLADLHRFPQMDVTELEYRAKLTELAFANRDLQRIWNGFRAKGADNPESPHAKANWRVVRDVSAALGDPGLRHSDMDFSATEAARINRAARELLNANTSLHLQGK